MRKIFAFLSCLTIMPAMAQDDACTKPNQFTTDKRCYVTSEQKKSIPYSTTVALVNPNTDFTYCTGTIVKGYHGYNGNTATKEEKETIYVYTAKHCTDINNDGKSDTNLTVKLQDGNKYTVTFARAGNYNTIKDTNLAGDYALYTFATRPQILTYTKLSDKAGVVGLRPLDARVVGYGSLKIMSDKEIQTFKDKYAKFLNTQKKIDSVNLGTTLGKQFLANLGKNENNYYQDIFFNNNELKTSKCTYLSSGIMLNCQMWNGNSGGGIFDANGRLMGIATRATDTIGGDEHAGRNIFLSKGFISDDERTSSIPIAF